MAEERESRAASKHSPSRPIFEALEDVLALLDRQRSLDVLIPHYFQASLYSLSMNRTARFHLDRTPWSSHGLSWYHTIQNAQLSVFHSRLVCYLIDPQSGAIHDISARIVAFCLLHRSSLCVRLDFPIDFSFNHRTRLPMISQTTRQISNYRITHYPILTGMRCCCGDCGLLFRDSRIHYSTCVATHISSSR